MSEPVSQLDKAWIEKTVGERFLRRPVTLERNEAGACDVRFGVSDADLRTGDTISGPTLMMAADAAAYICLLTLMGQAFSMATSNLNISFLRRPPKADIIARASMLKLGRRLGTVQVAIHSAQDDSLVAHATVTYALPERREENE